MSSQKKIIVTNVQSLKIHKVLKADKGETPLQQFIDAIVAESEIEPWIAERFASAWRWNHRNDNDLENTQQDKKLENYYTASPLPCRTATTGGSDPSAGTGKVAQIIALAEEGKTTAQIIELGYNKSTVYRQVSEWKKRKAEAKKGKAAATA
jgi:hypothetical protein